MVDSDRGDGVIIEDLDGKEVEEETTGRSTKHTTIGQSNSILRNATPQPRSRSSSLISLSSGESSPRRRQSPSNATKEQQVSQRSLSPRSNSGFEEESPDTTFSGSGNRSKEYTESNRRGGSRDGSEEMELDYGESEREHQIGRNAIATTEMERKSTRANTGSNYADSISSVSPRPRQRHSPSSYIASPWLRRRSLSPPRPRSPSPVSARSYGPSPPPRSTSTTHNSPRFLPPARGSPSNTSKPPLIKLYLPLPRNLTDSTLLHYFSSLSPPVTIHSLSLHTDRPSAFGFILVSRQLWENGEISRRVFARGGIWLERARDEWSVRLTVARDQVDHTLPQEQVKEFRVWRKKESFPPAFERRENREEIVGLVLEGFRRNTSLIQVQELIGRTLRFWESLSLEDAGNEVRVRLEVRGEKAAVIVERDFDRVWIGDQRIRVRRVARGQGRYIELRGSEGRNETIKDSREKVDDGVEERRRTKERRRSRSRSRDRDSEERQSKSTARSKRQLKDEEEDTLGRDVRDSRKRRRIDRKRSPIPSPHRDTQHTYSRHHSQRSVSPVHRSHQRSRSRSLSPPSHRRNSSHLSTARPRSPSPVRRSRGSHHSRHSTKIRLRSPSPKSLPRQSSPDPAQPDPRYRREDTPILRSSLPSRVPLPRNPTPTQPRGFEPRFAATSFNQIPLHSTTNRPQLARPSTSRPWQDQSWSNRDGRGEDRWARNGWNQVEREQIAREVNEREERWNRRD